MLVTFFRRCEGLRLALTGRLNISFPSSVFVRLSIDGTEESRSLRGDSPVLASKKPVTPLYCETDPSVQQRSTVDSESV